MSAAQMALAAADDSANFTPPSYLLAYYRRLEAQYGVAWQVLAALSYAQGDGYQHALSGDTGSVIHAAARATLAEGGHAASAGLLGQAAASASSPSTTLIDDARGLAAAGAAQSPGKALESYTGSATTAQEVLTIAQQIGGLSAIPSADLSSYPKTVATTASASTTSASTTGAASSTDPASSAGATTLAGVGPKRRLVAMETEARLLNGMPYIWGGGHEQPAWLVDAGYDCSGFVSEVLHAGGYLDSPDTTQTLPDSAGILAGPGTYVTIYDRTVNTTKFGKKKATSSASGALTIKQQTHGVHLNTGGRHSASLRLTPAAERAIEAALKQKGNEADNTINDEHVIIDLDGQWWESGGDAQDGGGEMVHRIAKINQSYLKSFNLILHPAGL